MEATDVVRVVLQFLKENGLNKSLLALQEESQVALNTVENLEAFLYDVQHGHWESVMTTVGTLKLTPGVLWDLYEQALSTLCSPASACAHCSSLWRCAACARAAGDARAGHCSPDPAHRRAHDCHEGTAARTPPQARVTRRSAVLRCS